MSPGAKLCPKCGLQAPLNAYNCAGCGHVYSTQFNPSQTQAFIPQPQPYAPQYAAPVQRDEFEWKIQVAWLWFLAVLASHGVYFCLRSFFLPGTAGVLAALASPFASIAAFGLLTFCVVRLRRLYKYDAPHRSGWGITMTVLLGLTLCNVIIIEANYVTQQERSSDERAHSDALP